MGLAIKGSTTKNLVKEVHQAVVQGTTDLQPLKIEINSL